MLSFFKKHCHVFVFLLFALEFCILIYTLCSGAFVIISEGDDLLQSPAYSSGFCIGSASIALLFSCFQLSDWIKLLKQKKNTDNPSAPEHH